MLCNLEAASRIRKRSFLIKQWVSELPLAKVIFLWRKYKSKYWPEKEVHFILTYLGTVAPCHTLMFSRVLCWLVLSLFVASHCLLVLLFVASPLCYGFCGGHYQWLLCRGPKRTGHIVDFDRRCDSQRNGNKRDCFFVFKSWSWLVCWKTCSF